MRWWKTWSHIRISASAAWASACLAAARELAARQGCYKIMLMTGSKRESTLRLYERAGYNRQDKTAFVQWL